MLGIERKGRPRGLKSQAIILVTVPQLQVVMVGLYESSCSCSSSSSSGIPVPPRPQEPYYAPQLSSVPLVRGASNGPARASHNRHILPDLVLNVVIDAIS